MSGGYELDPETLTDAARGIDAVVGELDDIGMAGSGEMGRGLSRLTLTGMQCGKVEVQRALGSFCDRWAWGVRSLMHDAQEIARRLDLSAGLYHDTDAYIGGSLQQLKGSAVADPHRSGDQVQHESWRQMTTEADTLDDSPASLRRAGEHARSVWRAAGQDVLSGPGAEVR